MKPMRQLALAAAALAALGTGAGAAEKIRMATIAPGSSAYLTMSTMATIVNQEQDDYEITVDATGAATKHMVDLAQGKLDFVMSSPTVYDAMKTGSFMYQKLSSAPELAGNVRLVFWFPYGTYHFVTYADDGMTSLEDIRGKKVFLGPPGGGAWNTARQWIEAQTGMKPGEDYENFKGSWSSAFQAFQDRQVDVYAVGGIPPFPQLEQLTATSKLRLLGPDKAQVEAQSDDQLAPSRIPGRSLETIPAGTYGPNVVNTDDVYSLGSVVGVATRADLDEDTVYAITKAFWEGAEKMRDSAPWLKRITLDYAVSPGGMALHPGAARYYEEIGVEIPEASLAD
ncbi:TAXI family TRAP transporter solute-binding subunit [Oceanicella sp. SM1341]|uniref:TAXI family TRAP transporter solute-binding subunit n=1 Tax=Oceanicella sp. SM1341 TaxID=1548889 RepID=UPI000E540596|nr:TAXI family TRAP transporter solute-binding subunit [Oceanicella sp. SM1341]